MKHPFPVCINFRKQLDLQRKALLFIKEFESGVYPVLFKFDILDEKHIVKYLGCISFRAIYEDLLTERPDRIAYLEQEERFSGTDHWSMFRDSVKSYHNDPQKEGKVSPGDPAFVFAKMPLSNCSLREQLIGCISYEKGQLVIDYGKIEQLSVVHPTDRQLAMFEILSELCDRLKKEGLSRENICKMLCFDSKSREMRVFLQGLLKKDSITIKK